jgi:alcohol dehydrogenase class IV
VIPVEFGDWPGRIVFGGGAVAQLRDIVARHGGSRALVLCGNSVANSGLLDKIKAGLGDRLASVFPEVAAHTPVEMVARALAQFRDSGADCVVTVGGGSTIDAGKAICLTLATGGDLEPYAIRYTPGGVMERQPLPASNVLHIAVPTTAGSASDVMPTAACRDPQTRRKLLFWDDVLIPKVTVLDPEMAVAAPPALTAATGMTAMARAIETL